MAMEIWKCRKLPSEITPITCTLKVHIRKQCGSRIIAEIFQLKIIYLFKSSSQGAATSIYSSLSCVNTTLRLIYTSEGLAFSLSNGITIVDICCCRWQQDKISSFEIASFKKTHFCRLCKWSIEFHFLPLWFGVSSSVSNELSESFLEKIFGVSSTS